MEVSAVRDIRTTRRVDTCARVRWVIALLVFAGPGCSGPATSTLVDPASGGGAGAGKERPTAPEADDRGSEVRPIDLDREPHLVGWWKLDEESGEVAADSTRYRRDGVLFGDSSFEESTSGGRAGKALRFDGSEEGFVEISGYSGVRGTQARTVAAWIKTKDPEGEIVSWRCAEDGGMWVFGLTPSGFGVTRRSGYVTSGSRVRDGTWHHVAVVVEKAEPPDRVGRVLLYKDGIPEEIGATSPLDRRPVETARPLNVRIGRELSGALDDVRIYDRALSPVEVEVLFRSIPTASGVASYLRRLDQRARKLLTHSKAP